MVTFYIALMVFLFLNMGAAMVRVALGPTTADRLLTGQLFGTTGVAVLLLLAEAKGEPFLRDVAIVFALLAVVVVTCFTRGDGDENESAKKGGE